MIKNAIIFKMRMLTASECRDAMGFPADYKLPAQHREAVHLLGNAVCPPVARAIVAANYHEMATTEQDCYA